MNIIDVMRSTLGGGTTTSAISSLLGLNQDQTQRATSATIPTLLAGLTHAASTPQGAEQLSDTISRQDPGMLDDLPNSLSGQGGKLADQGHGILNSLMGGGTSSMLGGVLSKFTGVGEGPSGKLLGLCIPLILGVLGKQQRSMGLGASGLANFLSGQKDNIRAAMPAGLESKLSNVPGFSQFFGARPVTATTAEPDYSRQRAQATPERRSTYEAETPKSNPMKWAIPLLLGLAVLGGIIHWARQRREEPAGGTGPARESVIGAETSFVADSSRLVTQATSVLSGIKDSASAEAAVPKLKSINDGLSHLSSVSSQLPESTRSTAKEALKPALAKFQDAAQYALNIPGVGDTIRPYVDQITSSVNSLAP